MPYIDFKEIKRNVTIYQAAQQLGLMLKPDKQQYRGLCPTCNSGGDRALVLTPERGLFYCFAAKTGGDCFALVQHITGINLQDAAEFLLPQEQAHTSTSPASGTAPAQPASTARVARPKPETTFDAAAFAAKLVYSDEVAALGFTEELAERFGIGFYRGYVYIPVRDPIGTIAGFVGYQNGQLKMPPKWLAAPSNVVALRRA